ncbi:hypothetical protein BDN70DRAFT_872065 [Pholiota conissans]|uniref:Uncharacterized protein n=1 Tax=Pholiota conissans TaxID=109636 RepID=A0A9P5ZF87_9AGAR|nr:hypothetical protein BDN70DRAFT_872065 [Pholiota conissans]
MPPQTDPSDLASRQDNRDAKWRSSTSLTSAYHPSIFLLCALIFWTGLTSISEVLVPLSAFFFALVTYAPTLYFAVQSIVRWRVRGDNAPDTLKASRYARILTDIWIFTMIIHTGLWSMARHDGYEAIFLLPTIPGSQATLIMIFIVIRYTVDIHMTSREKCLARARDAEDGNSAAPVRHAQPTQPELQESQPTAEPLPDQIYQPSPFLLLISIYLSLLTIVIELRDYSLQSALIVGIVTSLGVYIPTLLLHVVLIVKVLRGRSQTLKEATVVAGFSFDLIPLWICTRCLMVYSKSVTAKMPVIPLIHLGPSGTETLLIVYFVVRYTQSIYAERRRRILAGEREDIVLEPIDDADALHVHSPTDSSMESSAYYQPPTEILVLSIVLSIACSITESLAEPICGIPMFFIVYAPTIIIHMHIIYQRYHKRPYTLETFNQSCQRSLELCLLWLLTQAFYIFVWPVSQYLNPKVMIPWIRWQEVGIIVYITVRFLMDRYVRGSAGIRLPPDPEDGDPSAGPSSAV